ncbi:MAG: bifunctional phosphopantothenoylcysteine decarboxylase/phosphopantothenate--cysteine ligase CoaBC [Legionellaceae bacterium]|nr:bifunctional phosphopantothenoylcysteine decarboxylase/phosphopantothenate--cysteine ligase CoaBC [Legionellaceae bacterium]
MKTGRGETVNSLHNKNVVLGICGGIAAYKACWLIRDLQREGANVRVVLTASAEHFVSPLSVQALSGYPVRRERFDSEAERAMSHIELARWADFLLIAPATANTLARLAQGMADDLLSTLYLATEAAVVICPAMNRQMWQHPAVRTNMQTLQQRGHLLVEPGLGEQACGEYGSGRLADLATIIDALAMFSITGSLRGEKVLITAGPTQEPLDPVRYLTNRSSGKMGYALAQAAVFAGAEVTLVSGPVALPPPSGLQYIAVRTALDMHTAAMANLQEGMVVLACAAVADYRPATPAEQKIKKQGETLSLQLVQNPDIIADMAQSKRAKMLIGFAAETENLLEHARQKRQRKGLDFIIANPVGAECGFEQINNQATIIGAAKEQVLPLLHKRDLAAQIIAFIAQNLQNIAQV